MRIRSVLALILLTYVSPAWAQTPVPVSVSFEYDVVQSTPPNIFVTVDMASKWTPKLYVNGTPFIAGATFCAVGAPTTPPAVPIAATCNFVSANIASALTPTGDQVMRVSLIDPVLGEGPLSSPLPLARPPAPMGVRRK